MLLLTGPAGSGKTTRILDGFRDALRAGNNAIRLLVPTANTLLFFAQIPRHDILSNNSETNPLMPVTKPVHMFALALLLLAGCGDGGPRQPGGRGITFVHATDPHIFLKDAHLETTCPTCKEAKDDAAKKKKGGVSQQHEDEIAWQDMLRRIPSLSGAGDPPLFLVMTGDLGVDPCDISKSKVAASQTAETPKPGSQTPPANELSRSQKAAACVKDVDTGERTKQIDKTADLLGNSPLHAIYLVAGNNDIAEEDSGDEALDYFNRFIDAVQAKIKEKNKPVRLYNLTQCYVSGNGDPSSCYADVAHTNYRLIGFPSYSFKNSDGQAANPRQAAQLETFRGLVEQARQAGRRGLIVTHIPEIDDPFLLAQARLASRTSPPKDGKDAGKPEAPGSAWKVSQKLLDDWNGLMSLDSVAGVLAGHLHDSHKVTYRQPYQWSSLNNRGLAYSKLLLAPPLAIKNQDASPTQARGFSLISLEPGRIEPRLYWYSQETGEFTPDGRAEPANVYQSPWWPRVFLWLWELDQADALVVRVGIPVIAFLFAFLTVMAIWQIPPGDNPFTDQPAPNQKTANTAQDASVLANRFSKTVISGLGGLALAELAKAFGNQPSTSDSRWFYLVWFVLFFFLWLVSTALWRAAAEALRTRLASPKYTRARLANENVYSYWAARIMHGVFAWGVPFLTFSDTFINLIQGKNQTMTNEFSRIIVEQQRNIINVADSIRKDLNQVIEQVPAAGKHPGRVRVNISVLSKDQSSVFYISYTDGSARLEFTKRSVAWVSVFTGKIRWYLSSYTPDKTVLFDNSKGTIAGSEEKMMLDTYYQDRGGDYEAFVIFPVPWPQREFGTDYVKGAIHISFRTVADLKGIWEPPELVTFPADANLKTYPTLDDPLNDWPDAEVRATLRNSKRLLGELLRGFNETIFKSSIERKPWH